MTFIKKDGKWIRKHFRSGRRNCLLVPDSSRPIMSSIQLDKRGHQPHAFGNNPGLVLFGDEGFIPFVREEETGFYLMPCMPPSFKDPDVYSEEILNLNYAVDDVRFEYSSKLEEQVSVQALPARGLKSKLKRGLKLSIAFKKPIVKGTKRKNRRVSTQRSIDSEVTDNGKCQSSSSGAPLKNKRKGITEKLRSQILRKYPPKRNIKIKALGLPPRLLREYIDHQCPICHTMKRRHPKRSSSLSNAEKCNFKPWQTVYVDTSGRWRSKSSRSNRYHTVFVCARSDFKFTFHHKKRSHFPLVYMKFVARIGSHPQHLISDKAGEINSKKFDSLLLAKGCQHICLPKGEHYSLGVPEKAIGDLDRNTRSVMADANIPPQYWDQDLT
jgi:hypothetical protein